MISAASHGLDGSVTLRSDLLPPLAHDPEGRLADPDPDLHGRHETYDGSRDQLAE